MKITTFKIPDTFSESGSTTMLYGSEAINKCLELMVKTSKEELLGLPDYGSNLEAYRLEPNLEIIEDMITEDIVLDVYNYDKRISMGENNIKIKREEEKVYIDASYYLKNEDSTFSTMIDMEKEEVG